MNRILSAAEKAAKQERRAIEGEANMARYLEQQQSTLDKTARLRALRLAQASQETTKPASRGVHCRDHSGRGVIGVPPTAGTDFAMQH
jgi:4-alpha-glucanotransferase